MSLSLVGLMVDARCAGYEEEFFRINPGVDPTCQVADVADRCRQLPLHLRLSVQWLNECLSKADWKDLRQCGQGLPSLCDTMVCFYQVNSLTFLFSLSLLYAFLSLSFSSWKLNESFVSVHDALDRASIRQKEFQFLQIRQEERKGHIRQLETLEGKQTVEISKLKEEVKRSEGELRGHD